MGKKIEIMEIIEAVNYPNLTYPHSLASSDGLQWQCSETPLGWWWQGWKADMGEIRRVMGTWWLDLLDVILFGIFMAGSIFD